MLASLRNKSQSDDEDGLVDDREVARQDDNAGEQGYTHTEGYKHNEEGS